MAGSPEAKVENEFQNTFQEGKIARSRLSERTLKSGFTNRQTAAIT
jgi:hypothetical protein